MKFAEYCKCGGQMTGSIKPDDKAKEAIRLFWGIHSGQGHARAAPSKCYSARRKAEALQEE